MEKACKIKTDFDEVLVKAIFIKYVDKTVGCVDKTQSNGNRSKAGGSFGQEECCDNVSRETLPEEAY